VHVLDGSTEVPRSHHKEGAGDNKSSSQEDTSGEECGVEEKGRCGRVCTN
jgi:hypothetical protein